MRLWIESRTWRSASTTLRSHQSAGARFGSRLRRVLLRLPLVSVALRSKGNQRSHRASRTIFHHWTRRRIRLGIRRPTNQDEKTLGKASAWIRLFRPKPMASWIKRKIFRHHSHHLPMHTPGTKGKTNFRITRQNTRKALHTLCLPHRTTHLPPCSTKWILLYNCNFFDLCNTCNDKHSSKNHRFDFVLLRGSRSKWILRGSLKSCKNCVFYSLYIGKVSAETATFEFTAM